MAENKWYVVHTYSGFEGKVKVNLEHRIATMGMQDKIFNILIPVENKPDPSKKEEDRKIFPGYVLIEMVMDDESWFVVRNTPGVTGFIGLGNKPSPLSEREVHNILSQIGLQAKPKKIEFNYDLGDKVKIKEGPFVDFIGEIREINHEKQSVKLLLKIFGRETSVELDFSQVEEL
ncbi:MAG: transcription termination/antitermination protein NusG [Candidatus Wallbacteria bacterium]|nr:transcription termination/antitermination protein NusG [Candidatus Wallbacteria bacterium]